MSTPPRTYTARRAATVCVVTVDPSGDAIGAGLAHALRERGPVNLIGAGGPAMREAGVRLLAETNQFTSLGLSECLRAFPRAFGENHRLRREIAALAPDLLVLIDCGVFNVRLARAVRRRRPQKTLYYVPPGCWSLRWRIAGLSDVADYFAVPFPWNLEGDEGTGRVRFVGHPAADLSAHLPDQPSARRLLGLDPDRLTIGLLPGSRSAELAIHLPVLLAAARLMQAEDPDLQFVLSQARTVERSRLAQSLAESGLRGTQIVEGAGVAFRASDVALVCMGTATLEGCVLGCPMVTVYRGNWLQTVQYVLRPPRTSHYALPNIVAGARIVPEIVQSDFTPERLAAEARPLLRDPDARAAVIRSLEAAARQLGGPGAAARAAEAVWDALEGRWERGGDHGTAERVACVLGGQR